MADKKVGIIVDVDVKGSDEIKGLNKELASIGKAGKEGAGGLDAAAKSGGGLSSSVKGLVTGGLLAAAGAGLVSFGKNAITAASDVEEMQSKFNAVFKDLGGSVTAELETFADAANRSIYDLQGFAATLQDTFVPLGFARDEAAATSIQLVKLAEDLASFNNLDTESVINDLQSAMVGNTETLRKYGIVASQAAIDQEALSLGLEFTKGKMDAQTKAAAILSITMKSTTDAQGDAIRTADSYANQLKGMEAAQQELNVALGQIFLPIAGQVVGVLTDFARGGAEGVRAMTDMKAAAEGLASSQFEAGKATQNWDEYGRKLVNTLEENNDLAFKLFGGSKLVGQEMQKLAATAGDFSGSNEELAASLSKVFGAEVEVDHGIVTVDGHALEFVDTLKEMNTEYVDSQNAMNKVTYESALLGRGMTELAASTEDAAIATKNLIQADEDGLDAANRYAEANRTTSAQIFEATKAENLRAIATEQSAIALEAAAQEQERLKEATAGYFVEALNAGEEADSLAQQMFNQAQAAGVGIEGLAGLAAATGLWTDEQVDAALKAAAINTYIEQQAARFAAGEVTLGEYTAGVKHFAAELNALDGKVVNTEVNTRYTETGSSPVGSPRTPANQNKQNFASGVSDFVVPPGYPNDSYPIGLTSGEVVNVAPNGGGGATNNNNVGGMVFNVYTTGNNAAQDVQRGVGAALRELGIKGF